MKKIIKILLMSTISVLFVSSAKHLAGQCEPFIRIDGDIVIANETVPTGLALPIWLKEGQTVSVGLTVKSISIIEFTVNGTSLEFSQVISLTSSSPQSVPTGKVWKVESIVKKPIIGGSTNVVTYSMSGTNTFTVPPCAEYICIEVWGAGGGGQGGKYPGYTSGGGGGGGAYGQECFLVTPGTSYTVTVGAGGAGGAGGSSPSSGSAGGSTSVGSLISANGGNGGVTGGGTGGTSTAAMSVSGFNGLPGSDVYPAWYTGGNGGDGGNGGSGGLGTVTNGNPGVSPGGGGAGGGDDANQGGYTGGKGANGKVRITW